MVVEGAETSHVAARLGGAHLSALQTTRSRPRAPDHTLQTTRSGRAHSGRSSPVDARVTMRAAPFAFEATPTAPVAERCDRGEELLEALREAVVRRVRPQFCLETVHRRRLIDHEQLDL